MTEEIKKEEILDGVKSAVAESVKPINENLNGMKAKQDEIDARLKKIENTPLGKMTGITVHKSGSYKGYKLGNMLSDIREKAAKDPKRFQVFGNDEKAEEFAKFMIDYFRATGLKDVQAQMELQQKASELAEGSDSLGGYLVPVEYQNELILLAKERSIALQECSVVNMASNVLKMPTEASRVSVTWEDEKAEIDESNPTFGQVTLTAKKLAGLTDGISLELLQDSGIDIPGLLTEQFMYAIGLELDNQLFNGTGSPVSGLLTAACGYSVVMAAAAFSTVTADNFSQMIAKLSEYDLANAKFVMNKATAHFVRTLKDSSNTPIFTQPALKEPSTIYGYTKYNTDKVTGTTGASTAFALFGDLKGFYIGRRLGAMALDSDPYSEFNKALVRFRILSRWGMAIGRNTKFVRLVSGS